MHAVVAQVLARGVPQQAAQAVMVVVAHSPDLYALWIGGDSLVCVLDVNEPLEVAPLLHDSDPPASNSYDEKFISALVERASRLSFAGAVPSRGCNVESKLGPALPLDATPQRANGEGLGAQATMQPSTAHRTSPAILEGRMEPHPAIADASGIDIAAEQLGGPAEGTYVPASGPGPQQMEGVTTLMLRNVPPAVTQTQFIEELDHSGFAGLYDFCYMPSSFGTGMGKGYAFVNFTSVAAATKFIETWHGSRRFGASSPANALNVSPAAVQGREQNVRKWDAPRMRRVRNPALRPFVTHS